MTGELDSEPRPTCWDRWAGWSWKVVSPCRLTGLVLTLMTSERFVWIQMSSDGFVWICMGSDEFIYIQIQIWMEEMDRDGFRQIEMESDKLRWIQMFSNGLRLTQVRWPPWAAVQGWWVQELTLRNNPGFRISPSGCSSSIINQALLQENTAFTNISPPERTYFLGEFMSLVVMRRPFVSVGSSLICRSNESSIFFGSLIWGKLHQTSNTILHLTS